ncbi:MAG: HAD family hydrolase [Pseudobdellovibrionaceae bacterium]
MTQIKYVFWDSDNTLVDTATHHWNKHLHTLKDHYGIDLDPKYMDRIYTNNGAQNWDWLSKELGLSADKETYLDQIDQWYFDHIDQIAIRDGILEALEQCQADGLQQAVVSNGRRRSVMAAQNGKSLTDYFAFILCKEDYEGRKPDPAPYTAALKRMEEVCGSKIDPQTCLVIEDDPKGVEAGHAAGMMTLHRRLSYDQPVAIKADATAFSGDEFLSELYKLTKG